MPRFLWKLFLWTGVIVFSALVEAQNVGDTEVVFEWVEHDYDWENPGDRDDAIADGTFIPHNNIITGIKVYNGDVYVTVSRWLPGVPSTMNKVIEKDGQHILQPYPDWAWQELDNCDNAFQFTQSMEIDPVTGYMYIIDTGRRDFWLPDAVDACAAQFVVIDLNTNEIIMNHIFPHEVLAFDANFLNDVVVDPISQYAYMSDAGSGPTGFHGGIVVLDMQTGNSHRFEHESMEPEPDNINITIGGQVYPFNVPSNGIALSPDRSLFYYCPLGGYNLYHVPTEIAQNPDADFAANVRNLGPKVSQTAGMLMGHKSLYYAALGLSATYGWEYVLDMELQDLPLDEVEMITKIEYAQDDETMVWPDTFAMDLEGWLWVTPNKLPMFRFDEIDWSGASGPNFRVVKIFVDDIPYIIPPGNSKNEFSRGTDNKSSLVLLCIAMSIALSSFYKTET